MSRNDGYSSDGTLSESGSTNRTILEINSDIEDELLKSEGLKDRKCSENEKRGCLVLPTSSKHLEKEAMSGIPTSSIDGNNREGGGKQAQYSSPKFPTKPGTSDEGHRQMLGRYRTAERRISKYENQKNLCEWELKRFNEAKKTMKDKVLVEYVNNFRNRSKTAKTTDALGDALNAVALSGDEHDEKTSSKRNRSENSSFEEEPPKKVKSGLVEFIVFVVNEAVKGGRVVPELWQLIESGLTDLFLEVLEKETPTVDIQFYGAGTDRSGHKYLVCSNMETVKWLESNVGSIGDLGDNVKLKCITDKEKLNRFETPKAWIWIPKPYYTEEKVLRLLRCQNKKINTSTWSILKTGPKRQHGQHFLLEISKESLKSIEELNGYLNFSVARVVVKPKRSWEIEEKVPSTDGIAAD